MKGKTWLLAAGACAVAGVVMAEGPAEGHRAKMGPPGERDRGEFRREMKERFEEMDSNKDKQVTFEEFKAFHDARLQEMFKKRDRNGDGVLSAADFPKGPAQAEPTEKATTEKPKTDAP